MPANLRWYPAELPALTQSTSSSSALETAVRSLQNDARTQAIRQALSRRSSGIIAAAEQNRGAIVIGSLMPLTLDPATRSQPASQTVSAVGTVGYVFGGGAQGTLSTDRVTFATDAVAALTDKTVFGGRERAAASRLVSGILAGGVASSSFIGVRTIEEFTYATETPFTKQSSPYQNTGSRNPVGVPSTQHAFFIEGDTHGSSNEVARVAFDSKSVVQLPTTFPQISVGAAISTPSAAIVFGWGWIAGSGVYRFQYATESVVNTAATGSTSGISKQVLGSAGNAWVFGGESANPTWNYRYSISANTYTRIAANLTSAVVNRARVGSSAAGYLCGGTTGPYHAWNSYAFNTSSNGLQTVTKFTYATESLAAAPNSLTVARSHGVGISNFAGAFA